MHLPILNMFLMVHFHNSSTTINQVFQTFFHYSETVLSFTLPMASMLPNHHFWRLSSVKMCAFLSSVEENRSEYFKISCRIKPLDSSQPNHALLNRPHLVRDTVLTTSYCILYFSLLTYLGVCLHMSSCFDLSHYWISETSYNSSGAFQNLCYLFFCYQCVVPLLSD